MTDVIGRMLSYFGNEENKDKFDKNIKSSKIQNVKIGRIKIGNIIKFAD